MCKLTYEIVRRIVISETSWYIIPVAITIANQSFHRNLHVYYKCFLPSDRNMACVRYENKNTSVIFISTHKLGKKYNGIFKANFSCTNEINISILLHHWVCSLIDNTHAYDRGCLPCRVRVASQVGDQCEYPERRPLPHLLNSIYEVRNVVLIEAWLSWNQIITCKHKVIMI